MFFLEALRLLSYDRIMSCQTKWLCLPLWNRVRTKRLCIWGVHICWRWLCQTHWCYCQTLSERNTKQQFTLSEHVHFLHSTGWCRNAFWVFLKQKKALQGKAWGRLLSRKRKVAQQEKEGWKSKAICHFTSCADTIILKSLGYLFFSYSICIHMLCLKKK